MNHLAVIAAAASSFLLGGLWYSPALFGNLWNREAGRGEIKKGEGHHPAQVFGVSFVFSLIAAYAFAWFAGSNPPLQETLIKAALIGAGFVATSFGINYQFASRSTLLWLIDAGYHVAQFLLFGLIIGLWH